MKNEQAKQSALIHTLYSSFAQRDYKTMAECYHPEARFKDEVFELKGNEIAAMWHMLCVRGKDLSIDYDQVEVSANTGSANWVATYTFSQTGRKVKNEIAASFIFKDGLILNHQDDFDFWRWSTQALGFVGLVLGWSDILRNKVSQQAMQSLRAFIRKHPEYEKNNLLGD
jgi:ketosteroid isomerase-like protein